jgi:4-amino-4-deoxy-L-arabinose transferase and related glycosyltransferases of PMT family
MEGHGGHVWYYLVALPFIIMPFGGLLVQLVRQAGRESIDRFLWFWFAFVFVFFSLSNTQLPHYLLYGITPLLLLLAKYCGENPQRWLAVVPAVLVALLLLFLPELLAKSLEQNPSLYFQGLLEQAKKVTGLYYRTATFIYLLALLALLLWPKVQNHLRLIAVAALQTVFLTSVLIPVVAFTQQAAVKEAARFARHHLVDSVIVMDGVNMPSFTTYRQATTPRRAPEIGEYVFSKADHLQPPEHYVIVFKQGGLVLAKKVNPP